MNERELRIHVNGEPHRFSAPCSVASLLDQLSLGKRRIAVAINHDVIPRSTFEAQQIQDGDRIEILEAVGGG